MIKIKCQRITFVICAFSHYLCWRTVISKYWFINRVAIAGFPQIEILLRKSKMSLLWSTPWQQIYNSFYHTQRSWSSSQICPTRESFGVIVHQTCLLGTQQLSLNFWAYTLVLFIFRNLSGGFLGTKIIVVAYNNYHVPDTCLIFHICCSLNPHNFS